MKMISRRDFLKASAVVGATGVLTALSLIHILQGAENAGWMQVCSVETPKM